jgi:hypothetical protein
MKISLNLAHVPSRRERYALACAVPLAVLGIAGLAVLTMLSVRNVREYRRVREDVGRLEATNHTLAQREEALRKDLDQPQSRTIFREAQFVNSLIDAKKFSAADLTRKVGQLMPATVRLSTFSLTLVKGEPRVEFSIEARDAKAVETFLTALEDSPDFQDVAITNQGFQTEGTEGEPVTVRCAAQYVGGGTP